MFLLPLAEKHAENRSAAAPIAQFKVKCFCPALLGRQTQLRADFASSRKKGKNKQGGKKKKKKSIVLFNPVCRRGEAEFGGEPCSGSR